MDRKCEDSEFFQTLSSDVREVLKPSHIDLIPLSDCQISIALSGDTHDIHHNFHKAVLAIWLYDHISAICGQAHGVQQDHPPLVVVAEETLEGYGVQLSVSRQYLMLSETNTTHFQIIFLSKSETYHFNFVCIQVTCRMCIGF